MCANEVKACHKGDYSMANGLVGARNLEKAVEEAAEKGRKRADRDATERRATCG